MELSPCKKTRLYHGAIGVLLANARIFNSTHCSQCHLHSRLSGLSSCESKAEVLWSNSMPMKTYRSVFRKEMHVVIRVNGLISQIQLVGQSPLVRTLTQV
jgi:hypothetical protein